ncbi:hypothetical protein [Engelhardtia mirabilis]|uniref:Uncharacterized protein n=1 Tax=Engelhardtia mirabilis TaxID=2528011 RepID=A0A518BHP0_9BACT|nr:hypothetical protein Pla133_15760 [Planctomycetes bacterium Pla133]QDV00828.1 hypothetical protein Pla86_15750 [Planctomycetes bacterium Pla86]
MMLCALAGLRGGEPALAASLASRTDPFTGRPFDRVSLPSGREQLRSPAGGRELTWPLRP